MKLVVLLQAVLIAVGLRCCAGETPEAWKTDIRYQPVGNRPCIEARYTDASRKAFTVEAENYRLAADMMSDSGHRIRSLQIRGRKGFAELLTRKGIYLEIVDSGETRFSSLNAPGASRINIYRRGPYYIETHWLDVQLADSGGRVAPVKGEVVFYSYPEKTHVGVILHVTGRMSVKSAAVVCELDAETCASPTECKLASGERVSDFVMAKRADGTPTCALVYPVPNGMDDLTLERADGLVRVTNLIYSDQAHGGSAATWEEGKKPAAYFEIFPLESSEVTPDLENEIQPLLSANITTLPRHPELVEGHPEPSPPHPELVEGHPEPPSLHPEPVEGRRGAGGEVLGYDAVRGCYKLQTDNPGGFGYHYEHPNDYEVASFAIQNSNSDRKVYILHETRRNPGSVECGVVLDEAGTTLPITVQTSKNFPGEKEEPFYNSNDTPFSETIFPLHLESGECRKLTSLHLYQNWGSHPLKQFSSLGAWMDYFHMSTGVTETTCYVPFLFGGLDGVSIADMRPMSQKMWESQPQHDNVAGHSFLRYRDSEDKWHYIEYTGATFRSTGPNWADVSLGFLSDDGKAKVTLDIFELPQTDELRNFIHMRVDFLERISIKDGDFAENVRLLNIASWVQGLRYAQVACGGPTGEPIVTTIKLNDDFTLAGEPLPTENGFAAIYPDKRGANAFIVRRLAGKIGGEPVSAGVSVIGQKNGDTILMLVPVTRAAEIKAGDYLDIDLFLMPYGGETQDWMPARKAAFDYGLNAPKVASVAAGTKLADFPTRIALDENGVAEFSVTGGFDCIPIIAEGAKDYVCQRLYEINGDKKTLIDLARLGERDGYQVFAKEDGTFGWVFLVKTDGKEHRYRVE